MNVAREAWPECPICGGGRWRVYYSAEVRVGRFGNFRQGTVCRCQQCGVDRLDEQICVQAEDYVSGAYRQHLGQGVEAAAFFAEHDALQLHTLKAIWPANFRSKTVADIGCAAGSLLDHISGIAERCIAIEPLQAYHDSLRHRGYQVYQWASQAAEAEASSVDLAFCLQVIEHVDDPRGLLADMAKLLRPGGLAIVSTPNRDDLLLELLKDSYAPFFYRAAHRWYFDRQSLSETAARAGLTTVSCRFVQRYDLSNFVGWLRDRRPTGSRQLSVVSEPTINAAWTSHLEALGRSDTFYLFLQRDDR